MEILTNGKFPATRHRVVIPEEEVTRSKPRQSFVLFVNPDDPTVLRPICNVGNPAPKSSIVAKNPEFLGMNAWQYQKHKFDATY